MKTTIRLIVLLGIVAIITGCATPYLSDRGRDVADIFTVQIGGGIGAKARIGAIQTGLIVDTPLLYLRGGKLGSYADGEMSGSCFTPATPKNGEVLLIGYGRETFDFKEDPIIKRRRKSYKAGTKDSKWIPFLHKTDRPCPSYYTQIELAGGILGTGRLGFNPGELLDFILGWSTVDIFNDDIGQELWQAEQKRRAGLPRLFLRDRDGRPKKPMQLSPIERRLYAIEIPYVNFGAHSVSGFFTMLDSAVKKYGGAEEQDRKTRIRIRYVGRSARSPRWTQQGEYRDVPVYEALLHYCRVTERVYSIEGRTVTVRDKADDMVQVRLEKMRSAVAAGQIDEVKRLLAEEGADVNAEDVEGRTLLYCVADRGQLDVAALLLRIGADVNAKDRFGRTPLDVAVDTCRLEMVKLLLEAGADPNAKDDKGETLLYQAARRGNLEIVMLLLNKGADPNARTRHRYTPLAAAARVGHLEVVKVLLENGANVNATTSADSKPHEGLTTPLHYAATGGHLEVIKLLLGKGADVNAKAGNGSTPLSLAVNGRHSDATELLKQHGAKEKRTLFSQPVWLTNLFAPEGTPPSSS